jgi:hypothetical protein
MDVYFGFEIFPNVHIFIPGLLIVCFCGIKYLIVIPHFQWNRKINVKGSVL